MVDGEIVAAAEEERFNRRQHGKRPAPFSAWELPEYDIRLVPVAGRPLRPQDIDAVAYSFDPALAKPADEIDQRRPDSKRPGCRDGYLVRRQSGCYR